MANSPQCPTSLLDDDGPCLLAENKKREEVREARGRGSFEESARGAS